MRDREWHKVVRVTLRFQPQPHQIAVQRHNGVATLGLAEEFRGSPFSRGPPCRASTGQSRRSLRFIHILNLPLLTHTIGPVWWKMLCPIWTLIAQPRKKGTRYHFISRFERRLPHIVFWAHAPRTKTRHLLGQSCSVRDGGCRSAGDQRWRRQFRALRRFRTDSSRLRTSTWNWSLVSLLRRVTRTGTAALGTVDSRVVWGAVPKGRSSSRKLNFLLRKLGFWCLAYDIALELVWVPTWANPAAAPFTEQTDRKLVCIVCRSFRLHRPQSSHQPTALGAGSAP